LISRILIVGLGSIGKRHLRVARELLPNADIRVLRHQLTNEIPEYSNGCFFDIKEAINFLPQIAVIANPAPFHITAAQALSKHGIHLLVEKPLSSSLDGVAIVDINNFLNFIIFNERLYFSKTCNHLNKRRYFFLII
jgi:predicted dehydrogenase